MKTVRTLFDNYEDMQAYLKTLTTYSEVSALAGGLEARNAPSYWVKTALKRAHELMNFR